MGLFELRIDFNCFEILLLGPQVLLITEENVGQTDSQLIAVGMFADESLKKRQRDVMQLDPLLA
jgi:hypothetical protein